MREDEAGKWAMTREAIRRIEAKALRKLRRSSANDHVDRGVHRVYYERYCRLALIHEAAGRSRMAEECRARAAAHLASLHDGGPPRRPAVAAGVPRRWTKTIASGRDAKETDRDAS